MTTTSSRSSMCDADLSVEHHDEGDKSTTSTEPGTPKNSSISDFETEEESKSDTLFECALSNKDKLSDDEKEPKCPQDKEKQAPPQPESSDLTVSDLQSPLFKRSKLVYKGIKKFKVQTRMLPRFTRLLLRFFPFFLVLQFLFCCIHAGAKNPVTKDYLDFAGNCILGIFVLAGSAITLVPRARRYIPMSGYNLKVLIIVCLITSIFITFSVLPGCKTFKDHKATTALFSVRIGLLGLCFLCAILLAVIYSIKPDKHKAVDLSSYVMLGSVLKAESYLNEFFADYVAPSTSKASDACIEFFDSFGPAALSINIKDDLKVGDYWEDLKTFYRMPYALSAGASMSLKQMELGCPKNTVTREYLYWHLMSAKKDLFKVFDMPFPDSDDKLYKRFLSMREPKREVNLGDNSD